MIEKVLVWHEPGKTLILKTFGEEGRAEFEAEGPELETWTVYPCGIKEGLSILEFEIDSNTGEWINARFRGLNPEELIEFNKSINVGDQ